MAFLNLSMVESAASDVREYPLPGSKDPAVYVRATAASYQQLRDYNEALNKGGSTLLNHQAKMIATCILKPDSDTPLFESDADVKTKMATPGTGRIMLSLLMVALMRNGLKDEMPEEVEKK